MKDILFYLNPSVHTSGLFQLTFVLLSTHSPLTIRSQSAHYPLTVRLQSAHCPLTVHSESPHCQLTSQDTQLSTGSVIRNIWLKSNGNTVRYMLITIWTIKARWLRSNMTTVVKFVTVSLPWAEFELSLSWDVECINYNKNEEFVVMFRFYTCIKDKPISILCRNTDSFVIDHYCLQPPPGNVQNSIPIWYDHLLSNTFHEIIHQTSY
jgi:hypothetical protein